MHPVEQAAAVVETHADSFLFVAGRATLALEPALTSVQLRALFALRQQPDMSVGDLAAQLQVRPPTATQLCDRLEAAGLIIRTIPVHNRRRVALRLSPTGQTVLGTLADSRRQEFATVLAHMTPSNRLALQTGLAAFSAALDELTAPQGKPPP